jgi:hypothetical protein
MAEKRVIRSIGEIGQDMAQGIRKKDIRHNRFWNMEVFPIFVDGGQGEGFFSTKRKTAIAYGSNRSGKTVAGAHKAIMIYTGIIPPALQGLYAWEETLKNLTTGPNKRARYVRIVVMDYGKHFNTAIRPLLEDNSLGYLPEAWSEYDPVHHQYHGPDGSILDIFSADPAQDIDPNKLRGGRIDHTWIDEINREAVYTESAARGAASKDSMGTVDLTYCPQNGFDWTYETFHNASFERKGDRSILKPLEQQNKQIYVVKVCMKDNPYITLENYERQKSLYRPWEVAFRVDGEYSERTSDAYFKVEPMIEWEAQGRCSAGVPAIVHEEETDPESGTFKGKLELLDSYDVIQEGQRYDERYHPVWRIWEKPKDGEKYILSADIGEGNRKSDPHSMSVWRCTDPEKPKQVAHLHITEYKPGNLALQACCMANVFGDCLLVPEANNTGGGMFLDRARRYVNMYKRIEQSTQEDRPSPKTGWFTSKHNKGPMLDNAYKMLMKHNITMEPSGKHEEDTGEPIMQNYCPFNSRPTLGEFISYQERLERDKNGISKVVWGAPNSAHDDCCMEAVIAWKVIRDEFSKINTCKIRKNPVVVKKDEHYLGKKSRVSKAFDGMRKQESIRTLGAGRGVRNGRR